MTLSSETSDHDNMRPAAGNRGRPFPFDLLAVTSSVQDKCALRGVPDGVATGGEGAAPYVAPCRASSLRWIIERAADRRYVFYMSFRVLPSLPRAFAILSLCVAFALGGLAHRLAAPPDLALLAYTGAGGALADICGGENGNGGSITKSCGLCVMAGVGSLPERSHDLRLLAGTRSTATAPPSFEFVAAARLNRNCPARAPPLT